LKILALTLNDGAVTMMETPAPALAPGCVRVRTLFSAVSPGTEGNKIVTGRKSLLGKAKARPDQVKMVLDMARSVGIKGTIRKVRSKLEGAQPLGYSLAGEVIETGEGVSGLQPGDLVACGGGGYANHADEVVVPANLVVPVPEGVAPDAAAFATIGAIAMQGLRLAEPTLGETAVVVGLGIIGQLAGQMLRANGCRVAGIDVSPEAVEQARRRGAVDEAFLTGDDAVEPGIERFTGGRGADLVLICAATPSSEPVTTAGRIVRQRGRVIVVGAVGMDLPRPDYYEKEIRFSVSCSYGPGRYDPSYEEGGLDYPYGFVRWTEGRNMEAFLDLCAAGRIDPLGMVTHRFPFAEAPAAYKLIADKAEPFTGVLLEYPDRPEAAPAPVELTTAAAPSGAIGVGCIGAGSYAQAFLLPHFKNAADARLTAIHTKSGLTAADAGRRYGFARAVDSTAAVHEDPDTAAVVIASRHDSHGPETLAALKAGRHVFVEKPLCLDEEQLRAIAAAMREAAAGGGAPVLQVGFNRRFSPAAREARRHFGAEPGPLTMMYRVNAGSIPRKHWIQDPEQGGGRLIGEVCHFIDLMQFLCGADPIEVRAICVGAETDRIPEDDLLLNLRFADGSIGTVGYFAHGAGNLPKERLEISGADRTAVIDNFSSVELYGGGKKRGKRCPGKGQAEEVAAFLEAVRTGEPAIPLVSQFAVTLATIKGVESLRTGKPATIDAAGLFAD